jgi:hypothetical protein
MTRPDAELRAQETARRLWNLTARFQAHPHRRWMVAGPLCWLAIATSDEWAYHVTIDDETGDILGARREQGTGGMLRLREAIGTRGLQILLVLGVIGGLLMLERFMSKAALGVLLALLALSALVWIREQVMRRRG